MVWLACRKAWILSRLNFSASCTLVVNPPACHPLQAHLVLESHLPSRLILYWIRLRLDIAYLRGDTSCALAVAWQSHFRRQSARSESLSPRRYLVYLRPRASGGGIKR